jgi:tetratricopeptide (TPR) repeat protein
MRRKNEKTFMIFCGFRSIAILSLFAVGCQTTRLPTAVRSSDNSSLVVQVSEDPNSLMWNEGRQKSKDLLNQRQNEQKSNIDEATLQMRAEVSLLGHMTRTASDHARIMLRSDIRNVRALKILIKSALIERKSHEALALTESALSFAPTDAELYSYEGLAQHQLGKPLYAKALWTKSLSLDPNHIPTLMNLAVLLFQNGHSKKAGAYFDRVLALQPQHLDAQVGRALVMSSEGQSEMAVVALESILQKTGDNVLILENLANISRDRLKDYKRAAGYVDRTLALNKADRRSIETAVGMKQELRKLMAAQEKKLTDENLRELAAKSIQSGVGTATEVPAAESNASSVELQQMEDSLK